MTLRKKASITNHARHIYEEFFDSCRRETNKRKQDLSQLLSTFMPSDSETILMNPPDTLKNKMEREVWCKEQFRPYFYEWIINNALLGHTKKYSEGLKGHKKGGKDTVAKTKPISDAKKDRVIKKRNEYLASGKFTRGKERGMNKIIAKVLKYNYNYVQDVLKLQRRNENTKC